MHITKCKGEGLQYIGLGSTNLRVRRALTVSSVICQTSEWILAELFSCGSPHFSDIVT